METVRAHPVLRTLAVVNGSINFFFHIRLATSIFFAVRVLGLGVVQVGLALAVGNVGIVLGTLAEPWISRRLAARSVLTAGPVLEMLSTVLLMGAAWHPAYGFAALVIAELIRSSAIACFNPVQERLRSGVTPVAARRDMRLVMHFVSWMVSPFGALMAMALGAGFSAGVALGVSAAGTFAAGLVANVFIRSEVRGPA